MILAVLAAIPFAYFKIQLPFVVSESLGYFQAATNTMALLVVGGSIRLSALKNDLPLLMRLCGVKLLLMPPSGLPWGSPPAFRRSSWSP